MYEDLMPRLYKSLEGYYSLPVQDAARIWQSILTSLRKTEPRADQEQRGSPPQCSPEKQTEGLSGRKGVRRT